MKLIGLVGSHIFSGIETGTREILKWGRYEDCGYIKFILDGVTYMALEDPDDGYRSYMDELEAINEPCKTKLPDIPVYCKYRSTTEDNRESDLLDFYDKANGECFLTIGTEDTDDYYPYCVLRYKPEKLAVNDDKKGFKMSEFKIGDVVKITDGLCKGLVGVIDGEKMQSRDFLTNHELTGYPVNLGGPNHICMMFSPWDLSLVDHNKEGLCELQGGEVK